MSSRGSLEVKASRIVYQSLWTKIFRGWNLQIATFNHHPGLVEHWQGSALDPWRPTSWTLPDSWGMPWPMRRMLRTPKLQKPCRFGSSMLTSSLWLVFLLHRILSENGLDYVVSSGPIGKSCRFVTCVIVFQSYFYKAGHCNLLGIVISDAF